MSDAFLKFAALVEEGKKREVAEKSEPTSSSSHPTGPSQGSSEESNNPPTTEAFDAFMAKLNLDPSTGKKKKKNSRMKFTNSKPRSVSGKPISAVGKNRLAKGPDGTRGFGAGRGRPLS